MTLNDFCSENAFQIGFAPYLLSTSAESLVQSRRNANAVEENTFQLVFSNHDKRTSQQLFGVFKPYGFTKAFNYTPLGESVPRAFRYRSFERTSYSANSFDARVTLVACPSVEI